MEAPWKARCLKMVKQQIARRGIARRVVLDAMESVPRHLFMPQDLRHLAYEDRAVPIGGGQTISQPYIVAFMTDVLELTGKERVLEVGTGSGYQTAILAEIVPELYSLEIRPDLAARARKLLERLGYENVRLRVGDGSRGWPEAAPFHRIIVTAAPESVPPALVEQLAEGGAMIIPVGRDDQELELSWKKNGKMVVRGILPVRFVPMAGSAGSLGGSRF